MLKIDAEISECKQEFQGPFQHRSLCRAVFQAQIFLGLSIILFIKSCMEIENVILTLKNFIFELSILHENAWDPFEKQIEPRKPTVAHLSTIFKSC